MPKYVFSTLTASQKYPIYKKVPGRDMLVMESYVFINGGANLPTKVLVTPRGVVTEITDEEYERLQQSPGFQQHLENGFLSVEDKSHEIDKVVADLKPKDKSAPMIPEDFEEAGMKPPTTATMDAEEQDADNSAVRPTQRPVQAKVEKPDEEKSGRKRRGRPPGSKNKAS